MKRDVVLQEQDHHVKVQKNVAYLNGQFVLGSKMAYFWFSSSRSSLREVSHENLGM